MTKSEAKPEVSVVVASFCGEAALRRCLERLVDQENTATEILVATDLDPEGVERMSARYPSVRFLRTGEESTSEGPGDEIGVFRLRTIGVAAARGRIVVLTEDHCLVSPGWVESLVKAHDAGAVVAGGPVDSAERTGIYDWALYLAEYAALMPPMPKAPPSYLSAVNASYGRDSLEGCRHAWQPVFYDNEVHDVLAATGHRLEIVPEAWIRSELRMSLRIAILHLFTGGRRFGSYRKQTSTPAGRAKWIASLPLLPGLLMLRIVVRVARRRPGRLAALVLGLPWVAAFVLAWCLGEATGLLVGGASESPARRSDGC